MRIAVVGTVASSIVGFRADFIRALVGNGCTVFAFAVDYSKETRDQVVALGAVPIDYALNRSGMNPIVDIYQTICLAAKFKKLNLDLVFSYFVKPVIFATFAAKLARVRQCVGMLEGLGYIFTDQPHGLSIKIKILKKIQVFLYKFSLPLLDKLVFLNHDDPCDLLERYHINVKSYFVLGGIGVNLDIYKPSVPDVASVRFLFIGRLLAEKGINEFIDAAKIVKKKFPNSVFTVLGAVDEANPGSLSVAQLNGLISHGLIEYPGHVDNVQHWIALSSVFVLPSYREGLPRSTQEVMAMGREIGRAHV